MTKRKQDPRYKPGTFVKDGVARVAQTPADAVKAIFDGFKRQEDDAKATEAGSDADAPDKTVAETSAANETARTSTPTPGPKSTSGGAK